ncbi:zinc finger protein 830-like isoform X2 [Tachypleus tridentatus]|uniref:zinc finger protein 830-like isoform X2 n=1 Tax=Tachypleus tridentatus TaxID=6853 RepID=UPI003FD5DD29
MAAPIKKKINQNDLRQLMRERRQALKPEKNRIDSPLAKYNNLGQLTCVVCNVVLKNDSLWAAHIVSRIHKEKLEILKRRKHGESTKSYINTDKREWTDSFKTSETYEKQKLTRYDDDSGPVATKVSQTSSFPSECVWSDNEGDLTTEVSTYTNKTQTTENPPLPPGFFDQKADLKNTVSMKESKDLLGTLSSEEKKDSPKISRSEPKFTLAEALPEGFFDDPIMDAKVRKVEYKDPMEEEWEKFQKTIAAETNVSQAIIEEDLEESKVEREIDEIDEQIFNWERVEKLQKKKEEILKNEYSKEDNSDDNSSIDEHEFDEFLDWRSKGVWKL